MILDHEDRAFIKDNRTSNTLAFILILVQVLLVAHIWEVRRLHEDGQEHLDELCRAHYPECIVETTP